MSEVNPPRKRLPKGFDALARMVPARAIWSAAEHEAAVEMIDQLMRVETLSEGQSRYLETLVALVEAYESKHHAIEIGGRSGLDAPRFLMEESRTSVDELGRELGVSRSHAYNLVRSVRSLTAEHLRLLSRRFKVEPSLFL